MWRPPVGKGGWALRMLPAGADTVMGANEPSLLGIIGVVRHLTA
jgi:hypothetical protein